VLAPLGGMWLDIVNRGNNWHLPSLGLHKIYQNCSR
jgi:hypothetical protein